MIRHPKALVVAALLVCVQPAWSQTTPVPSGLADVELERSRTCVGVLERLAELDGALEPLAERSRRLQAIAEAIAIEDVSLVDPLDRADPVESVVADWFVTDRALAQRYVSQPDPMLAAERSAGRETVKNAVTQAASEVQGEANALLASDPDLPAEAAPCEGAIFVRSAVVEACASGGGDICAQVALPASEVTDFRFVDSPEEVWEVQELRPWTAPGPLRPGPTGQIEGGRTVGFARVGNIVVSVAFAPLLRERASSEPSDLTAFAAINDSLGLTFSHPDLVFAPALGVRVTLPRALGGETRYVLHFGAPGEASAEDVLWIGPADSGTVLESTVAIGATHARRLLAGDPLTLTALDDGSGADAGTAVFSIGMSNVTQPQAVDALLGYMSSQLSTDLSTLVPARGTGAPPGI